MTVHINLTIQDTPDGVTVRTYGPLHAETEAAFVARVLLRLATPLFAGGRPVRIVAADTVLVLAEPGAPLGSPCIDMCQCRSDDADITDQEAATLVCRTCGKDLLL